MGFFKKYANYIGGIIVILIGISLAPPIFDLATEAKGVNGGVAEAILGLVPFFFVLAILMAAASILRDALYPSQGFDDKQDEEEEKEEENQSKSQTYEQYVRERLKVEEMLKNA